MSKSYEQLYDEQELMEAEALDIRQKKEYRDTISAIQQGRFDETQVGNALMKTYFLPIRDKIQEYMDLTLVGKIGVTQRYLIYLNNDASAIAYMTIQRLIKKLAQRSNLVKVSAIASSIVGSLKISHTFKTAEEVNPKLMSYLGREYRRASASRKKMLIEKHLAEFTSISGAETRAIELKVGVMLLELVLQSGTDLIEKKKRWQKGVDKYATYYVSFTDDVMKTLNKTISISPTLALYPPMIVPPDDWTSWKRGGYKTVDFQFMTIRNWMAREKLKGMDLSKPMGVVNKLQKTAWKVNKPIADVIQYIYSNNLIDPSSPPTLPNLYGGIPTRDPTDIRELLVWKEYKKTYTKEEKKIWAVWNKNRERVQIGLDGEHGRRLQYLMTLGVVNRMIDYDRFYYVYQLDYRGRVYPLTDFFNPQSKGYVKAMLEFSEGHYLDRVGIYWLKVHLANSYGLDKSPFAERIQWVEDNIRDILRCAKDPLDTIGIWNIASSPFEFLAACMAIREHTKGNKVHLPIQLDAVNSGIQMYSGLLRDKEGAKSTCVVGSERADLYQEVADKTNYKLSSGRYPSAIYFTDKEGVQREVRTQEEARSLAGNFTRKMTKPNVMTVPYSVSLMGMQQQNWTVMDDMKLSGKAFWKGDEWVVNKLWTMTVHESIFEIVKGARAGQEYLKDVARLLTKPALWYTPIYDLPVLQPAYKTEDIRVHTVFGKLLIQEFTNEVKRSKQLSSIAANYIHSIDASILMYVVDNIGEDIGTIHDCFLVHPNQGERVRDMYKEGYVKVMRADPLKMFSEELDKEGKVEIPYVGDLDLNEVYNSEYIIS